MKKLITNIGAFLVSDEDYKDLEVVKNKFEVVGGRPAVKLPRRSKDFLGLVIAKRMYPGKTNITMNLKKDDFVDFTRENIIVNIPEPVTVESAQIKDGVYLENKLYHVYYKYRNVSKLVGIYVSELEAKIVYNIFAKALRGNKKTFLLDIDMKTYNDIVNNVHVELSIDEFRRSCIVEKNLTTKRTSIGTSTKHYTSSSRYYGVSKRTLNRYGKSTVYWEATFKYCGKIFHIGFYNNELHAAEAYNIVYDYMVCGDIRNDVPKTNEVVVDLKAFVKKIQRAQEKGMIIIEE